jgi:hypothetical protein
VKNLFYAFYLLLLVIVTSCNKKDIQTNPLVGKWKIINDSSSITGSLDGANRSSNYIGTPNDYYNFTSNGNLYIGQNSSSDTGKYSLITNNQVQIIMFVEGGISFGANGGIRGTYAITNLSANTVTLTLSGLTPEGQELEILNLKK